MMATFPALGQRDPRWRTKSIGFSSEQVGEYGCLYMCLAMLICHDRIFQPIWIDTLMGCLRGHGNYTTAGGAYLQNFDVSACEPPDWGVVKHLESTPIYNGPMPTDEVDKLLLHLHNYQPAILEVDPTLRNPGIGDGQTHFVLAIYASPDGHVAVNDPWFSDVAALCPRYGPNNSAAIYRAIYFRVDGPGGPAT